GYRTDREVAEILDLSRQLQARLPDDAVADVLRHPAAGVDTQLRRPEMRELVGLHVLAPRVGLDEPPALEPRQARRGTDERTAEIDDQALDLDRIAAAIEAGPQLGPGDGDIL